MGPQACAPFRFVGQFRFASTSARCEPAARKRRSRAVWEALDIVKIASPKPVQNSTNNAAPAGN
jgi:hypothetical protein